MGSKEQAPDFWIPLPVQGPESGGEGELKAARVLSSLQEAVGQD